ECLERFDEAHREARRAEALEPAGRLTAIVGAWPYIGERRFDEAIAQLQRVIQLDKKFTDGHFYLFLCYEAQSNYVAAIEEFKTACLMSGLDATRVSRGLRPWSGGRACLHDSRYSLGSKSCNHLKSARSAGPAAGRGPNSVLFGHRQR